MENEMTKEELIEILLGIKKDPNRKSCLLMAYNSAKTLSTGICIEEFGCIEAEYFSSLILYLIFLEQVGTIFTMGSSESIGILSALDDFTTLKEEERTALYYLRNTLAHNYGLATDNKDSNKQNDKYKFTLSYKGNLIHVPKKSWDNDYTNRDDEVSTTINIFRLMEMVDNIYVSLKKNYKNLGLKIGIEEIKTRFTVLIDENPSPKLYHFTSFNNAIRILATNQLKFGSFKNTNDIAEVHREVNCNIVSKEVLEEIFTYRTLSFTKDDSECAFEKDPLWGYYAEKGNGVCIQFDKEKLLQCFHKLEYESKWSEDVRYDKNWCGTSFDEEGQSKGVTAEKYVKIKYKEFFFTKALDWKHESEFRMVVKPNDNEDLFLDISDAVDRVILCLPRIEKLQDSVEFKVLSKIVDKRMIYHYVTNFGNKSLNDKDENLTYPLPGKDCVFDI